MEYEAQKLCAELLEEKQDALRRFRFVQGDAASLGMVCGGDVTLLFTYLPAGDGAAVRVFRRLMELSGGQRRRMAAAPAGGGACHRHEGCHRR